MASIMKTFKKYPATFWIANIIELLERWGWYGMYMVLALYLTSSQDLGGALGFDKAQQGLIMGIGTAILYFLPTVTGAIADRIGFKLMLILSFIVYAGGFLLLTLVSDFSTVFIVYLLIAVGSAMFKPVPAATVANTTTPETATVGFGIYYMMVNIGGLIGPVFAAKLRPHYITNEAGDILREGGVALTDGGSWHAVFIMSAIIMIASMIMVMLFYREPERAEQKGSLWQAVLTIFKNIFSSLKDFRLVIFLVLIIGFWTMYYQLFFTLPIFVDQWLDTRPLYDGLAGIAPWLASAIGTENGTISAEMMTTLPPLYIIIFQVFVSNTVKRWRPVVAMALGIGVNCLGLALTFMTNNPFYFLFTILIFALGEMASSPRIQEYLGSIAPKEKRGLYIGCSFLPVAGGSFLAGFLSSVFEQMSDKIVLAERMAREAGMRIREYTEAFTQSDFLAELASMKNMTAEQLTQNLWSAYQPYNFWMIVAAIGAGTVVLLLLYDRFILKGGSHGTE